MQASLTIDGYSDILTNHFNLKYCGVSSNRMPAPEPPFIIEPSVTIDIWVWKFFGVATNRNDLLLPTRSTTPFHNSLKRSQPKD